MLSRNICQAMFLALAKQTDSSLRNQNTNFLAKFFALLTFIAIVKLVVAEVILKYTFIERMQCIGSCFLGAFRLKPIRYWFIKQFRS